MKNHRYESLAQALEGELAPLRCQRIELIDPLSKLFGSSLPLLTPIPVPEPSHFPIGREIPELIERALPCRLDSRLPRRSSALGAMQRLTPAARPRALIASKSSGPTPNCNTTSWHCSVTSRVVLSLTNAVGARCVTLTFRAMAPECAVVFEASLLGEQNVCLITQ
jgi:hypothetical protein